MADLFVFPLLAAMAVAWLAGAAAWVGGLLAWWAGNAQSPVNQEFVHGVVAFGGGILVAAVAFALMPLGMEQLPAWALALAFVAGGGTFCALEVWLSRSGSNRAQVMAMMLDFVPESLAMGAVFERDPRLGLLLAAFIGAQNLPEGFNAFRESRQKGNTARMALLTLLALSLLGPLGAVAGFVLLRDVPLLTAAIMAFASGGILYLVFQDIAPQAHMRRRWTPALGAVLGFCVGMVGKQLLG